MDYLDPKKELQQRVFLLLGYILTAVAVSLAAIILLYQAYGFGIGKNGTVIQSSLTFLSSKPNPADIYLDGALYKSQTNSRLELPEGTYHVKLSRDGYRPWQRTIQVDGGEVQHYDYPLLIPQKLAPKTVESYTAAPPLATQSLDRRWLLVNDGSSATTFKLTDLKNKPLKPAEAFELPASVITDGTAHSWSVVEWADDNDHVLVQHTVDGKSEYVLIDKSKPADSVNLTKTLNLGAGELTLKNRKYDQYFLYDSSTGSLTSATLKDVALKPVLSNVLSFKSYGSDTILYATNNGKLGSKIQIKMETGKKDYDLKDFSTTAGSGFLLDLTTYNDTLYAAIGVSAEDRVYIYKDPLGQATATPKMALTPIQVLHVEDPTHLSFSSNAQFIAAESGQKFAVYDIENKKGFDYQTSQPLDAPQTFASWMDGNRLTYVSNGKQIIFDYDYTNQQELSSALPSYLPMFSQDYSSVFTLANSAVTPAAVDLLQTPLLTSQDQ